MPTNSGEEEKLTSEELEQKHFQQVINAFLTYQKYSLGQVKRKVTCLNNLPQHHKEMIPTQFERMKEWREAIYQNQEFLTKIVAYTSGMFVNSDVTGSDDDNSPVTSDDIDRVRTTLKQCVRDWSAEGAEERNNTYKLILDELISLFPNQIERTECQVLVPGAGLGRLMHEIAKRGFACQGNEFSLYMLFASNYILNMCPGVFTDVIHPWLHQTSNVILNKDQVRTVKIPDIDPQDLDSSCNFSMAAGDFLEVYTEPNTWDAVVMCFFLDTAHNVICLLYTSPSPRDS